MSNKKYLVRLRQIHPNHYFTENKDMVEWLKQHVGEEYEGCRYNDNYMMLFGTTDDSRNEPILVHIYDCVVLREV